ncbi:MAG: hypothetical protein JJT90_19135 [Ectothiorhodospiraceae bacterium]|nr:hypothetical protein [Ectothiorhodospiraceae bacterium]
MIIFLDNDVIDPEFGLLVDLYEFLDHKLSDLCDRSAECSDPDASGLFDQMEYLSGFGLVALQTYLTETAAWAGLRKHETFDLGPKTTSGVSKIKILNAVANFWKHREEWVLDGGEKRKAAVDELFEEVGYTCDVDYPISGVLTELLSPLDVRFSSLLIPVKAWRDDLIKTSLAEQHGGQISSEGSRSVP